ncbi:uncharacterized protein LOC132598868 isoform X3 [Lycium barbarum]|uniref:uncharacterized protein LOC132598868 isoform X3 n=1 Tax=Lycium barbarum TaxID=112863 RepID=UPI00293E7D38|nr:uncharacterized protein LOC132598868 isoform X3 [Lycium barbarum]
MALLIPRYRIYGFVSPLVRYFRSQAALKALGKASEDKIPNLILYNYPSFSGAFAALFAHLYHSRLNLPYLVLPFSSVEPFRICSGACSSDLMPGYAISLLNSTFQDRVENVLKYIQDGDLHRWSLPDIRAFGIGINHWRSKLNCITNPHMYEQLMGICTDDLIANGNSHISNRLAAANKLLDKFFKIRLGRGLYGECLGVRADGNSDLSDEIGKELSKKSAAAGLRPIGAVIYLQRKNLKMCLRTGDAATDTSEVAKAYGGGGSPSSSSFIIRMDEYNQWLSVHSS